MITAVDSSVLLDVFSADSTFGARSREALRAARADGGLVACEVVWAEVAGAFGSQPSSDDALGRLGVRYVPLDKAAAAACGQKWRRYRAEGGTRQRLIGDFLVGAHAAGHAERLLTRDRGFYRRYFADLTVLDPSHDSRPSSS